MARARGRRTWIFPDTELPPAGDSLLKGHESLIILNMNRKPARITLSLFFTDVPPQILPPVEVGGRTRAGRLDARQVNLAYSTTMGYAV